MIEIGATTFQILRLKCTKFDFGWVLRQTPLGELTALPDPIAGLRGPTSKGSGLGGGEGRGGMEGRGRGGRGRGRGEEGKGGGWTHWSH